MKAIGKYGKNVTRLHEDRWCHSNLIAFCDKIADFLIKGHIEDLICLGSVNHLIWYDMLYN